MQIRKPQIADRPEWDRLYADYAAFYGVTQTPAMRDRVWGWLHDPAHESEGLVAKKGERLVALAHFRPFARPLSATTGGYLDDLFVDPEARGTGLADAMLSALQDVARARGWTVIRWITAENNFRARAVYERKAEGTAWMTYDLAPDLLLRIGTGS